MPSAGFALLQIDSHKIAHLYLHQYLGIAIAKHQYCTCKVASSSATAPRYCTGGSAAKATARHALTLYCRCNICILIAAFEDLSKNLLPGRPVHIKQRGNNSRHMELNIIYVANFRKVAPGMFFSALKLSAT